MALITTTRELQECAAYFSSVDSFAFDVETMGDYRLNPLVAPVYWLSLAHGEHVDVIPMNFPNGKLITRRPKPLKSGKTKMLKGKPYEELKPYDLSKNEYEIICAPPIPHLGRSEVFAALDPIFHSPDILKIGHNIRFDLHAVTKYLGGKVPPGPYFDTMIASWLVNSAHTYGLGLDKCCARELDLYIQKGVGENIALHSFDEVYKYSYIDASATWQLYEALQRKFDEKYPDLKWLLNLEMEVLNPVLDMEQTGVLINKDKLAEIDDTIREELATLLNLTYTYADRVFNMNSNRHKQEVLFRSKRDGGQGLTPFKATPASEHKSRDEMTIYDYSVDSESLEHLRDSSVVRTMLAYAAKNKIHGTYVLPYLGGHKVSGDGTDGTLVESRLRDGRIYAQFLQHGTESGRFSSRQPNLQNIPSRTVEGAKLREIFIADPGTTLVVADYSQIEPRIIASLSGDETMIKTYNEGGDVYEAVADRMSVPRASGKELVLAMSYGIGPERIARRIGCSPTEARDLMDFFSLKFPNILSYKSRVIHKARQNGYALTIMNRRRYLPDLRSENYSFRSQAERQAFNHNIQGSAADIMKIALVNIWNQLPEDCHILMTVHDEVIVQCPLHRIAEIESIVKEEMESAVPATMRVPFVADIHHGHSWKEGKG